MGNTEESSVVAARLDHSGATAPASTWVTTARGKGKIKPRKAQLARGSQAWVPALRSVSESDAEHGEQEGDPRARYPASMADGWADYITLDTPQSVYRALNAVWDHRPVLLRGSPLVAGLAGKLGFRALAQAGSDWAAVQPPGSDGCRVEVLCSDAKRHRFVECDDAKNFAAAAYRVRSPETQRLRMGLVEFVQCAQSWDTRRVMLKSEVMRWERHNDSNVIPSAGGGGGGDERPGLAPGPVAAALSSQLLTGIDWAWLAGLRRAQRFGPVLGVQLEAGTANGLLPARYAVHDELLAQVAGRRRVLLVGPRWAFAGMYPYPTAHPYDRYSMVDLDAAQGAGASAEWARAPDVLGVLCVLRPGDVLHVPAYWFAHVQELEAENVALRFALHPGTRPPAADAAPLRLSRALEERVAAAEGAARVRRWLCLIARGGEGELLDLGTVAGYKRVVMCQGIRDEVEESLGVGEWARLLPAMCEGRLAPTPWLDLDARDPLLLKDRPVIVEDTRSEEERRFPQLFRRKLEAEGWAVPAPVSTVPVPGVNMPLDGDYRAL